MQTETESPRHVGSSELLGWLREQLGKATYSLEARELAENTWRSGDDESWKRVAKLCGGKEASKSERLANAEREARIAVKYRRDVAMLRAAIEILSHPNDQALRPARGEGET